LTVWLSAVAGWLVVMEPEERDIGEMSGGELLDHAEALARTQREPEIGILLAARQHAVLHDQDSIDPLHLKTPGGERPRRMGGAGTPLVADSRPRSSRPGSGSPATPGVS
jgi:hypothetical protein